MTDIRLLAERGWFAINQLLESYFDANISDKTNDDLRGGYDRGKTYAEICNDYLFRITEELTQLEKAGEEYHEQTKK